MIYGYTSRQLRLLRIKGRVERIEALILSVFDGNHESEYNNLLRDLYYLERLARKAP